MTSLQTSLGELNRPPLPLGASTEETLADIKDNTKYLPLIAQRGIDVLGEVSLDAATLSALETVSVGNFPATQPVSGAFFQATQPVSLTSVPSHAVTNAGIFAVQNTGADATNTVQPTVNKKLAVSTYSPSLFQNLGANATLNVKASAGNVFSLSCYNANVASRYIQLHNTATTPAGAAVPIFSFLVPSASQIIIGTDFFTDEGANFGTGIAFAFSTTINTYTAATAGDQSTFVQYK